MSLRLIWEPSPAAGAALCRTLVLQRTQPFPLETASCLGALADIGLPKLQRVKTRLRWAEPAAAFLWLRDLPSRASGSPSPRVEPAASAWALSHVGLSNVTWRRSAHVSGALEISPSLSGGQSVEYPLMSW